MDGLLPDSVLLELVERVYAAGCDPAEWPRLVDLVHTHVPFAAFSTHFSVAGVPTAAFGAGMAEEHLQSYLAHYRSINPYDDLLKGLQPNRVYTTSEVVDRRWLKRHPFYNEWLKPAGDFTHGATVALAGREGHSLRATFDIPDRLGQHEEASARALARLQPHLARAFELNTALQGAAVTRGLLEGILERIDGAAIALAAEGRILALNRAAEALARGGRLFRVAPSGQIAFRQPGHETHFRQHMAAAVGGDIGTASASFAVGIDAAADAVVTLLPLRLGDGLAATPFGVPRVLVVIAPRRANTPLPATLLRDVYGLTAAEAALALTLLEGASVAEAAASLDIRRTTARNQLAAVMAKIGVRRQAELITALSSLSLRLRHDAGPRN